jgi:hypothetical protein
LGKLLIKKNMNTYHICYIIGEDLCTGINVNANNYISAMIKFKKRNISENILYISKIK